MTSPILTTERLAFRPFTPDDLALIVELHSDPEVQRYMGGAWSAQDMQQSLDRFVSQQAQFGHSKWAAFLHDGTFVGRVGVGSYPPLLQAGFDGDRELGYCLKPEFWGGGLATEAALAVTRWFFDNMGHERLFGFTHPENVASQRVLVRVGMSSLGECDLGYDEPSAVFGMGRPG